MEQQEKEISKRYERIKRLMVSDKEIEGNANESFQGPSKYFSHEALKACRKDFLGERHIEMVYATLAAWGMHRTGKGGAKMPEFEEFRTSINVNKDKLNALRKLRIEQLSAEEFELVKHQLDELCFSDKCIKGSTTDSHIVSASKTLAHILPNLVPPIDRQYTAQFYGYPKAALSTKREHELLANVMNTLHKLYTDKEALSHALKRIESCKFVSLPKLFDNAIIDIQKKDQETKEKLKQ